MDVTLRSSTCFEQHSAHPQEDEQRAARNMLRSVVYHAYC